MAIHHRKKPMGGRGMGTNGKKCQMMDCKGRRPCNVRLVQDEHNLSRNQRSY